MKVHVVHGENSKEMMDISDRLQENKFKIMQTSDNFILLKRRRYGNSVIHLGVLFFALFFLYRLILINLGYFAYSYLARSPHVLVTTETKDENGDKLEFENVEDILEQANAIL